MKTLVCTYKIYTHINIYKHIHISLGKYIQYSYTQYFLLFGTGTGIILMLTHNGTLFTYMHIKINLCIDRYIQLQYGNIYVYIDNIDNICVFIDIYAHYNTIQTHSLYIYLYSQYKHCTNMVHQHKLHIYTHSPTNTTHTCTTLSNACILPNLKFLIQL